MLNKLVIVNLLNKEQQCIDLSGLTKDEVQTMMNEAEGSMLFVFLAEKPADRVVILCPGGGFRQVNMQHEGLDFAHWFEQQGVTLAVLKYSLPQGNRESPITDITNACHTIKDGINGHNFKQIGCMGASIGGYMAAYAAINGMVDFQIEMYTAFSMEDDLAHEGSRERMFGETLSPDVAKTYSLQYKVTEKTAPAFIVASEDDASVNPMNSIVYAQALMKKGVSVSLHIYPNGGHSFGFKDEYPHKKLYLKELKHWLKAV